MEHVTIHLHGDGAWPDIEGFERGKLVAIAALPHGTVGGNPSVGLRIELEDGRTVIAETTLRLLLTATQAFQAAHGDPRT